MTTVTKAPCSIEGEEMLISGLKISPSHKPIELPNLNEILFPISIQRRAESSIVKAYDPKIHKIKESSLLELNSKISGKNIWGLNNNPLSRDNVILGGSGRSSRHTGQEIKIQGICFMELVEGWEGSPLMVHPKNEISRSLKKKNDA